MSQIRPLNEVLEKTAIEELHEIPEDIPANIEALRTWIKQQPHLQARTDDQFLLAFLRGCKHSLERTKSKLDMYYTMRTKFPELFRCTDVDEPKFREALRLGYVCSILPTPLFGDGPRIFFVRSGLYPCDKFPIEDLFQVFCAMYDILISEDDQCSVKGIVSVFDLERPTTSHIFQLTPMIMKKKTTYVQQGAPFRVKGFYIFNSRGAFDRIFNYIKPLLSEKIQKRLWVYGNKLESMYEQFPQKYLPQEYGGENGSIEESLVHWDKKMDEYRDYFKDEVNYGSDEKLRFGGPIDFDSIFGLEGSFRKLNVD